MPNRQKNYTEHCVQMGDVSQLLKHVTSLTKTYKAQQAGEKDDDSEDSLKVLFHRDNFSHFLLGEDHKVRPITVELWPSLTCDARCPLCTYSVNAARREADKSEDKFTAETSEYLRLIKQFKNFGVKSLIFTGGGEPLLHPDFVKLVAEAHRNSLDWGMFTHGLHLSKKIAAQLSQYKPRFVRVSLNAGTPYSHNKEYKLGEQAFNRILKNAARAAALLAQGKQRPLGLGFAIGGDCSDEELRNIAQAISTVFVESHGTLGFASFRPKVIYYKHKGVVRTEQPNQEGVLALPERIREVVLPIINNRHGDSIRVDLKSLLFRNVGTSRFPNKSIASGWTGQIDHLGKMYVLSELNGSPWPDACYGRLDDDWPIEKLWESNVRRVIFDKYFTGNAQLPLNSKISHIEFLLQDIRDKFGLFTVEEVREFWGRFEALQLTRPRSWNFL